MAKPVSDVKIVPMTPPIRPTQKKVINDELLENDEVHPTFNIIKDENNISKEDDDHEEQLTLQ